MNYISKSQNIQGTKTTIYYQGDNKWTTEYNDRKSYETEEEATAELYHFGGEVVSV